MRYFGTDGIRNTASSLLSGKLPYHLGKAIAKRGGKIVIARDVRTHSLEIEKQLCSGLLVGNTEIVLLGILPTPALAYIAKLESADFAIMITASHNPPEYNGLKVFGRFGEKLSPEREEEFDLAISRQIDNLDEDEAAADSLVLSPHRVSVNTSAQNEYIKHLTGYFPRFDGIKVCLDCAHGVFAGLAAGVFEVLGAKVRALCDTRDGKKVNVGCGSTHLDNLISHIKKDEIGFAFDGDGDRVLAVVDGAPYDGDAILLAISTLYRIRGKLRKKIVVGTTLTNTRLQRELAFGNTALARADVGDKNVLDKMKQDGSPLGGEKSGHIIMLDRASTGDGLLTALTLLEVKKAIGSLPKFVPYPMLELNIAAKNPKDYAKSEEFLKKVDLVQTTFGKKGRLIVRPSGTEPYVRIVFECFSQNHEQIFEEIKEMF